MLPVSLDRAARPNLVVLCSISFITIRIKGFRMRDDVPADLRFDSTDIEDYLSATRMAVTRGPTGPVLSIPGHSRLSWPQRWLRYFRQRRNSWNFYEEAATLSVSFLIQKLRPKVFLDVGAAGGYFSRVAASHLDFPPIVHAFEVRPGCLEAMRSAIKADGLDGRVIVHSAALSDLHEGEREMWWCGSKVFEEEPDERQWRLPLWHRIKLALNGERRGLNKLRLTLTSIDHFVAEHGVVPDLIKIDVDGYEGKVLRGGLNTFATYRPAIALELHKDALIRYGYTRQSVIRLLTDLGYKALFLTDHHDRKACRVVPVDSGHALVARQETDFVLLH